MNTAFRRLICLLAGTAFLAIGGTAHAETPAHIPTPSDARLTAVSDPSTSCPPYSPNTDSQVDPQNVGYWLAGSDGGVFTFGNAPFRGSWANAALKSPVVAIAPAGPTAAPNEPDAYYVATADGHVYPSNGATFFGDESGARLNAPIVAMAVTGDGYYLVGADGGVFTFGDSGGETGFYGSLPSEGIKPNAPVEGISWYSGGYYLVAADGGVFTFGDAPFYGSMGGTHLNAPVVGIAAPALGGGSGYGSYWLVAADGGVFSFGPSAMFLGSLGNEHLNAPVVGIAFGTDIVSGPDPDNSEGYWLVAADGGVFTFGDVPFCGSLGGQRLNAPIVGMAAEFMPPNND